MCGIAGSFSPRGIDAELLPRMARSIGHRGPDGEGFLLFGDADGIRVSTEGLEGARPRGPDTVGFAHLRLSIIDLSEANDQPMTDASGELALIFNGEVYNYVELREELKGLGHEFRTSGDTEVVLASYAEWGEACLERFVGMWAFVMLDLRRRVLFLARDRFGVKPLYYSSDGGALHFASEIKAFLDTGAVRTEPDEDVVRRYLLAGATDETERTFFRGIRSLPPAHSMTLELDRDPPSDPFVDRYWSIPEEGYRGSRADAASEFRSLFFDSVALHARSDVPVGTCLSGGLDSSSIVCVAEELRGRGEIPSYTHSGFGYLPDDEELSERRFMEEVVRATELQMTYVEVTPERWAEALPLIARQQDEPFGSTSIAAQWFVFEAAKQGGMKVMLDGQGPDETLGGYHGYFPLIAKALLRSRHPFRYRRFARALEQEHGTPRMSARDAMREMSPRRRRRAQPEPVPPPTAAILSGELQGRLRPEDYDSPEFDSVHALLAAHTTSLGLPALLRFEDRNSMAHSIEARVPFLDHRLVELAFRLPPHYKMDGAETKSVLREALEGVLPEPIRTRRDKIGFRAEPSAVWRIAERHRDGLLAERTPYEGAWFHTGAVSDLMAGSDRSLEAEWAAWRVINTKLWLRSFWGDAADPLA